MDPERRLGVSSEGVLGGESAPKQWDLILNLEQG